MEKCDAHVDVCGCAIENVVVCGDIKIFTLKLDNCVNFKAGQFFMLSDPNYKVGDKEIKRAYSVCSSEESRDRLEFAITMLPNGKFSKHVENFTDGHRLCVRGPLGRYYLDKTQDSTFFAGGSGVSPFVSMLRTIRDQNIGKKATLVYSVRTLSDVLFYDELKELNTRDNINIVLCVTRDPNATSNDFKLIHKRIDDDVISSNVIDESIVYLCGPLKMVSTIKEQVIASGHDPEKVKFELW